MTGQVHFGVLSLINEERNAYGLRSNDYARYHAHCSHKVQRLRQKLKLTNGKGKRFEKPSSIPSDALTDAHLQLALFESERAYTHSQELTSSPDADASVVRHRATGRFRRAVTHSASLLALATSGPSISASTLLEIHAYHLVMNGRFLLRRDDFKPALENLAVARKVFDALVASSTTSRDQALFALFSDEIAPQIRFAAHSLGRAQAYDIDGVVKDVAPSALPDLLSSYDDLVKKLEELRHSEAGSRTGGTLREISWEGEPIPIRNPELVDVFLKVQNAEDTLKASQSQVEGGKKKGKGSKGKISAYDSVLLALSDAEDVSRRLAESQEFLGADSQSLAPGTRDITFIHIYAMFRLLSRRIERDLLLVKSLNASAPSAIPRESAKGKEKAKIEEEDPRLSPGLVKLYDSILASLEHARILSIVDESLDLAPSIEARIEFSKAKRVFYLSRAYNSLHQYAQSLALSSSSSLHLRQARSILSTSSPSPTAESFYPLTDSILDTADAELTSYERKVKLDWFAFNGGRATIVGKDGKVEEGTKQKKPLFFDVAFNYVELPMDRLLERGKKPPAKSTPLPTPTPTKTPAASTKVSSALAQTAPPTSKKEKRSTKVEEEEEVVEPVKVVQASGLGGLLGGWWGRK